MKNKHIVADVETGGTDCFANPITQVALQVIDNENLKLLDKYDTFIKPYNDLKITPEALKVSQTSVTEINNGVESKVAVKNLIQIFNAHKNRGGKFTHLPVIVGHNVGFDMCFLEVLFATQNKDLYDFVEKVPVCTMRDAMRREGYIKNKQQKLAYNLTAVCERYGIKLRGAHGAPADVEATTHLFIKLTKLFRASENGSSSDEDRTAKREQVRQFFEM